MRKRKIQNAVCFSIGCLAAACVIDVITRDWMHLFCNVIWIFTASVLLLYVRRYGEKCRELREQKLLNKKVFGIMADMARKLGTEHEMLEKLEVARQEASEESLYSDDDTRKQ